MVRPISKTLLALLLSLGCGSQIALEAHSLGLLSSSLIANAVAMKPYLDVNGNSGVTAYEYGDNWIVVEFRGSSQYLYTYQSTGRNDIEQMKRLAREGKGLNTYINKYVRKRYAQKLR